MKNNETGEFELVLGNRQLLSGFFIVVLLFGVAFAMGYIVGRNSTPSSKLQAESTAGSPAPVAKESRPEPSPATPTPAASQTQPPADSTPAPQQPAAGTPAQPAAQSPAPPATPPAPRETPPAPAPTPAAEAPPAEAPPGSYWQVIATSNRTAAEALQQSLKDKGFPVTLGPGPNNLIRVLVGPYSDTQSMGRAKTLLEAAGLHPVRK